MLKIVVDTNIVISAALSPSGNCAKTIGIIAGNEQIQLLYNEEILFEYEEVLSRKHLEVTDKIQKGIIESIKKVGIKLNPPNPSKISLPDESDRIFYDAALSAGAILITGNKKHYPAECFIILPAEFLKLYGI